MFSVCYSAAQGEANWWYFGQNAGINFNTTPPTAVSGSLVTQEGCSAISDAQGNLLMYTDGSTVYNANHAVMANGTGLLGHFSTAQSAVIIKDPGGTSRYYIFTMSVNTGSLHYSVVDMSLAAGLGSVTVKNVYLHSPCVEQLAAVRHANGQDYWIVVHAAGTSNQYRAYRVTATSVGASWTMSWVGASGSKQQLTYMKISPDGKHLASAQDASPHGVQLCDFDASTGQVSNPILLPTTEDAYGCEFSPDGTKLYASVWFQNKLYQWSICAGSATAIAATAHTMSATDPWALQTGPDGRIYVSRYWTSFLGVINNPNASGSACNFVNNGFSISPGLGRLGLPNYANNFFLPPVPDFTVTVGTATNGLGCMTASFTSPTPTGITVPGCAAGSATLTGLLWNFGDPASGSSNTSTAQHPTHLYSATGNYTASLILIFGGGSYRDTITKSFVIDYPCITVTSKSISCSAPGSATAVVAGIPSPISYQWLPTAKNASIATGLVPGSYTLVVKNLSSGATYTRILLFISPTPLTGALEHQDSLTCHSASDGTASVVNIQGGSSTQLFNWSNGSQTVTGNHPKSLQAGNWTVTVTDALTGCTFNHTFTITEPGPLSVNVSASPSLACIGSLITLSATATGGKPPGNYQFTWHNGAQGAACALTQTIPAKYVYTVSAENTYGCLATGTINAEFKPQHILAVNSSTVCYHSPGSLRVTGAHSYTWSNNANDSVLTDSPLATTIYTVRGSWLGCVSEATARINVLPVPAAKAVVSPSLVCLNSEVKLIADGGVSYSWTGPNNLTYTGKEINLVCTRVNTGQYTLTVYSEFGCPGRTTTQLEALVLPNGNLSGALAGCSPFCETYQFYPHGDEYISCTWLLPRGKATGEKFSYCFTQPGEHAIIGHFKSGKTGCADTRTFMIQVLPQPVADFSWKPEKPVAGIEETVFESKNGEIEISAVDWYVWGFEGSRSHGPVARCMFESAGLYPVAFVVTNKAGCRDTVVKTVEVKEDIHFYMPSAFTPNGDGTNDVFRAEVSVPKKFELSVYSRWGELLFATGETTNGWDGTHRGSPCKEDVYVWKASLTTMNGAAQKFEGSVTLIR